MSGALGVVGPSEFLLLSAQQCRDAALKAQETYAAKLVDLAEQLERMAGRNRDADRLKPPPGWPE